MTAEIEDTEAFRAQVRLSEEIIAEVIADEKRCDRMRAALRIAQRRLANLRVPTKGEKMFAWIHARLDEGCKVYVQTMLRTTVLSRKHADLLRVDSEGRCRLRLGKRSDIIDLCHVTARKP